MVTLGRVKSVCNSFYIFMRTTKNLSVLSFQETEIDVLATVQNLLRQCGQPSAFLRPLSKLFSIIHNKLPRQALTNVFQVPLRMEQDEFILLFLFYFPFKSIYFHSQTNCVVMEITDHITLSNMVSIQDESRLCG